MKNKEQTHSLSFPGVLLTLLCGMLLMSCQQLIRYTPPKPVTVLDEKQKQTPDDVAVIFFNQCLKQKNYRVFIDYASERFLFEGPDKEHFLKALKKYEWRKSTIKEATAHVSGKQAKVTLTLQGEDGRLSELKVFLVHEADRWRVDQLDPPLPYKTFSQVYQE